MRRQSAFDRALANVDMSDLIVEPELIKGCVCPMCSDKSEVLDSRSCIDFGAGSIKRTRACKSCSFRWVTFELPRRRLKEMGYVRTY